MILHSLLENSWTNKHLKQSCRIQKHIYIYYNVGVPSSARSTQPAEVSSFSLCLPSLGTPQTLAGSGLPFSFQFFVSTANTRSECAIFTLLPVLHYKLPNPVADHQQGPAAFCIPL